ncbi:MAG: hypothetical protein ACR2MS_13030 [Weeksellaceae bacterium]
MNKIDLLVKAINEKRQISFEYNKTGKVKGERFGNPYAVFIFTSKALTKSTKVHIVQTGGVSDSKDEKPFPDFRMFNIEDLSNIKILSSTFNANNPKYNPNWEGYKDIIEKV